MKVPILKEYGSWTVFIFSCASGIITGLLTKPWHAGRDISVEMLLTILGLVLLALWCSLWGQVLFIAF